MQNICITSVLRREFADAWVESTHNCIITITPYCDSIEADRGFVAVSNYYIASNAAYHKLRGISNELARANIQTKINHTLPARSLAVREKGFIGENGFYFHPTFGSMVYIGILEFTNATLQHTSREHISKKSCMGCGKCREVCPTGALKTMDMSLCIREHILKNPIPENIAKHITTLYGCERCQICCPENDVKKTPPVQFNVKELQEGEHFPRLVELVGKNIAKRGNVAEQCRCVVENNSPG